MKYSIFKINLLVVLLCLYTGTGYAAASGASDTDLQKAKDAYLAACAANSRRFSGKKADCACVLQNLELKLNQDDFKKMAEILKIPGHKRKAECNADEQTGLLCDFEAEIAYSCSQDKDYRIEAADSSDIRAEQEYQNLKARVGKACRNQYSNCDCVVKNLGNFVSFSELSKLADFYEKKSASDEIGDELKSFSEKIIKNCRDDKEYVFLPPAPVQ